MNRSLRSVFVLLGFSASLTTMFVPLGARADDDPAIAKAQAYCNALLAEMKTAKQTPVKKRYDQLEPAIRSFFDLQAMTKTAVGPGWATMDPKDQQVITDAFSRFTIATYASRFDGYSGEKFDVTPAPETRGENKVVKTAIVKSNGDKVALNYLMHSTDDGWKATDVYLAGTISELATRRGEFGAILKDGGPAALVERLNAQTKRQLDAS
jgi:phospholipid transport system substrate-binding protein